VAQDRRAGRYQELHGEDFYRFIHLPARSIPEQNTQSSMFELLSVLERDCVNRLSMSAGGLNGVLWMVLCTGTIVTVGFTFLFAFENVPLRLLLLIASMDYPFQDQVSVKPEAFREALRNFEQIETVQSYQLK
jgi:hypothetical protein